MFVEEAKVMVSWEWHEVGEVVLRVNGHFKHVDVAKEQGVYRIRLNEHGEQVRVYIGESVNLRRRISEDLRRIPADYDIKGLLQRGGNVRVDRAECVRVSIAEYSGRSAGSVDLDAKFKRLAVEGVALAAESPNLGILNRHRHMS